MRRAAGIAVCVLVLAGVSTLAQTVFEPANSLVVSEPQQGCPQSRVFGVRLGAGAGCGSIPGVQEEDACFYYRDTARPKEYEHDGKEPYAAAVMGLYWPGTSAGTYDSTPRQMPADSPDLGWHACFDQARFTQGTEIRARSFSYYIFDLSAICGSTIVSAILKFKLGPWYSNCFQPPGDVAVNMGIDAKRGCRGPLATALMPFTFPMPMLYGYQWYEVDVTQTVQQDLLAPGPNCLSGFILDSDDIDDAPGGRILGLGEFTLTVTQGTPIPTLSQWGMALWVVLLAGAVILLRFVRRPA
jgi:hypothetical protein